MKILLVIFLLSLSGNIYAGDIPLPESSPESVGLSSERLKRIDTVFETGISEKRIPGAVIAIARHGKLVFFKAYGMQNASTGTPMRTDSIFRISTTISLNCWQSRDEL